ncbi:MAG: bifunctional (p)ppGpp synthetase/guanosine-3',5'-bis(diphosphate) 3'-pyrophosphohydrolase [Paludibacteraceae bacterium]|nr:bifunctional (p)ppGpp synthetase/guanosine-3',5'-bis(diphosphate) 3'-pyrophosphohydrolase [Paludibacteraceae bacterium]
MSKDLKLKFDKIVNSPELSLTETEFNSLNESYERLFSQEDTTDFDGVERTLAVASILMEEANIGKIPVVSVLVYCIVKQEILSMEEVSSLYGGQVEGIVKGLFKSIEIYKKNPSVESENFRKLLMSIVEDIRVIIILICEQLYLMRIIMRFDEERRNKIAQESSYLYAPLAHRLGLYRIKSELEDLSLRQTNPAIYRDIAIKLEKTAADRDRYMQSFIEPLKQQLEKEGFKFIIKGRTKSIYSIWNKMRKQNTEFENVYDLFAIRIILSTPLEKEKSECWQVYSIVTDKYQPNPKRLRDWLSIPKSNGYESLHTTVMGPEGKWVEVQIRTERMDEIAEKGFAAHFKYKGVKAESGFDSWLANVRELLENPQADNVECMDDFKLSLYRKEVFVFTPKGDLRKLPQGATLLDFAFEIHSNLGSHCVGGRVNGKAVPIRAELHNGDQVEIVTNPNQFPHKEWLTFVQTSKAKTHIKQFLREQEAVNMEEGKEMIKRRLKNWKLVYDESIVFRMAQKCGYKAIQDFYQALIDDKLDVQKLKDLYIACSEKDSPNDTLKSVENYTKKTELETLSSQEDVLVIDDHLKGIEYSLSKCCNPIYGDDIFGFVSIRNGIKVHRTDCPNAPQLMSRFGYRFIKARWAGKSGTMYACTLHVIGNDDIGIVTNITSLIQKETNVSLRSISVDSVDGLFQGKITVNVLDMKQLEQLIKKIKSIKGVKSVNRT